jgi:hypothetical protein
MMNVSEGPPVSQKVTAFGSGELSVGESFVVREFLAECFEYAWDCYDDVDLLLLDDGDDLRWLVRFAEVHFGANQLGNKDGHHLSEDVAQWQQAEEAQWMYESFPACVFAEFFFDGSDVREQVAMCETDAFGLGGRA